MADRETIEMQVDDNAKLAYGSDFKFRPNQKDAIVNTICAWLDGTTDVIMQAPTGSGKSITAMTIASVLCNCYGKTGYILVSDLGLMDQYERDINKFYPCWAILKGQQTYTCNLNHLNFNSGTCKLKGCKSYMDIYKKFRDCIGNCEYLIARDKAMRSKLLVCTYSFWLLQQNFVKDENGDGPFPSRDFIICDESHKLMDIVQGMFSPKFGQDDENKFKVVVNAAGEDVEIVRNLMDIRNSIIFTEDKQKIFNRLEDYVKELAVVFDRADSILEDIGDKNDLSKEDRILVYTCNYVIEHWKSFAEYIEIISKTSYNDIIKNPSDNLSTVVFNCINESYLMDNFFHKNCKNKMYMSATIGDIDEFARSISVTNYTGIDIPSTFDFTNSPIYYVDAYKMSFKDKDTSFPEVVKMISSILRMYGGKRGIIQTGSYSFAKKLYEDVDADSRKRLLVYDDSSEKAESIEIFKNSTDMVLVGPSLIEGLSFDDDLCRFQIIMKVPYPSLKDKFVAEKQRIKPVLSAGSQPLHTDLLLHILFQR